MNKRIRALQYSLGQLERRGPLGWSCNLHDDREPTREGSKEMDILLRISHVLGHWGSFHPLFHSFFFYPYWGRVFVTTLPTKKKKMKLRFVIWLTHRAGKQQARWQTCSFGSQGPNTVLVSHTTSWQREAWKYLVHHFQK